MERLLTPAATRSSWCAPTLASGQTRPGGFFRSGQEASVGPQSRVNAAHEFLGGIGEAAERHGVDIMWCMSFPK